MDPAIEAFEVLSPRVGSGFALAQHGPSLAWSIVSIREGRAFGWEVTRLAT